MSKHLLKAMKQLQTPSAAQLAPRNFPIRGSVGSVFRPRLPNNMAIEFSIHKCNLVLSAYELQQSRPGHGAGKTKVMFNRHVHDIVANSNARFPVDSLQEVEKILRQSYSDCQSLLQRVLAFKSAYTMNPRYVVVAWCRSIVGWLCVTRDVGFHFCCCCCTWRLGDVSQSKRKDA